MAWFKKSGGNTPPAEGPDASLPSMTTAQADWLRGATQTWFAQHQLNVAVQGDQAVRDDGVAYSLANLSHACINSAAGADGWWAEVDRHFSNLLAAEGLTIDELSDDQFRSMLKVRVMDDAIVTLDPGGNYDYAQLIAPGLIKVLVLDLPTAITPVTETAVTRRMPLEEAWRLGFSNFRDSLTSPTPQRVTQGSAWAWAMHGDDPFVATMALAVSSLAAMQEPGVAVDGGVLFAVPCRSQLFYRIVDGAQAVRDVFTVLPGYIGFGYNENPGPVSPGIFYFSEGAVARVATVTDDGVQTQLPVRLQQLLDG